MAAAAGAFAKTMGATATAAATGQMGRLSNKAQGKSINWTDFNWPCRLEPCNLLHLPPWEELRAFSEDVYVIVRALYTALLLVMGVTLLNAVNAIVFSATLPDQFSGANIVYSILNVIIGGVVGTAAWFKALSGLAEHSDRALLISKACCILMVVGALVQAFGDFGNVNGLANLGAQRLQDARDADSGAAGYWTAASVIEPLLWLAAAALYCLGLYRLFTR